MEINNRIKIELLKIEKAKLILTKDIGNGVITEKDIINLLNFKPNFGLKSKNLKYNYKKSVLISIFNSPFILCDLSILSLDVKNILPFFLKQRYNIELDELKYYYEQDYISYDEYMEEKKLLKYFYFDSTADGLNIRKNGYIDSSYEKIKTR